MLTLLIVAINGWNRIQVGFRAVHPVEPRKASISNSLVRSPPLIAAFAEMNGSEFDASNHRHSWLHRLERRARSGPVSEEDPAHR